MAIEVKMPALSPTMEKGDLVRWAKQVGEEVQSGDTLLEIETDKAIMDYESVDAGEIVHLFFADGTKQVAVGTVLALLKEEGDTPESLAKHVEAIQNQNAPGATVVEPALVLEDKAVLQPRAAEPGPLPGPVAPEQTEPGRLRASPLARKIAQLNGVALEVCQGTGPGGRILKIDVERALQAPAAQVQRCAPVQAEGLSQDQGQGTFVAFGGIRRTIGQRLTQAKQEIPHFYMEVSCRLDPLLQLRAQLNQLMLGTRVSVNDLILKASAQALRDFPAMNVQVTPEGIRQFQSVDLAMAVSLENGLVTPIIRSGEALSLLQLSKVTKGLVEKARAGKLTPSEYQGGTFTVSNLGMFRIERFSAIINPPQASILAVSAALERPVVQEGNIVVGKVMELVLSADHRAVDGVLAAQFLQKIRYYLENPLALLAI